MTHTFSIDTTQLPVTSVCVYQADRAEVHRTLPVELEVNKTINDIPVTNMTIRVQEDQNEIKIERLPSGVEPDSIRVEGTGSAVIFDVIHKPPPPVVISYDKSQNPALHELVKKKSKLNSEKSILEQQATVLNDYGSSLKAGVADAAKLTEFLELYKERRQQIFDELQKVEAQISEVDSEQDRIKKEFWADAAGQKRQTKVTVVVLAEQTGKAELSLRYMVKGASWTPVYDLRAKISHAPGESSSITLQYKASISQKTGEDWTDVALTLSTAAPQLGATIPTLTPYKIGRPRPPPPPRMAYPYSTSTSSSAMAVMSVGAPLMHDGPPPPPPIAHATAQAIEGATSSTFVISGKSTIPTHQQDDEQTHKVSIAFIDLDAKLEWVAVPKAQTSAFLKCKVKNTSQYILLPGKTSVFMDDNFVCRSNLPSVSPNESFSTSLGVDPAIRITYHTQQRKSTNATGGLLPSKIDVTTYVQPITIKNTRATAVAPLLIKDQIPVSEDSDVKVLLTEPPLSTEQLEIPVARGIKAHWAPRDADREDEDKTANTGTEEDGVIEWHSVERFNAVDLHHGEMSHTFSIDTTQLPVTSVCVYQADRAEVHRTLPVELEEGQNEIKIERLPSGVEPDSIRVEGTGSAVIFDVIHSPPPPVVLSYDKSQNPALHDLAKKKGNLNAEKSILEQQATVLKDYGSTLKAGVADAAKLAEFLGLYKERKQQIFDELQKVKAQIREVDSEQDRIKKEFWADAAGQKRQTKVTVVILAQQNGKAELSLRYMVNGASWTPMYDLRAKISHAPSESSSITLQYKASISQKTGENWTDVALTLSTAAPQLGATIPTLTPYKIGRPRPPPPPPMASLASGSAPRAKKRMRAAALMEVAEDAVKENDDDDMGVYFFDEGPPPPPPPIAHATAQAIEGATSSTFVIAGKSTIPTHQQDDEQTHKVSVAVIDLDAKLEWVAVPKAQTSAFLKCKVKNTSQYILLPGKTSVFMDDNFVCKSTLPSVSPNESFSTSLGVDPAIRITYHPQQKKSKNATGGLLSSKIDVTAYVQSMTIKNTRATAAAPLFIKDQIPVSEDSDLKVVLTEPRLSKERPEIDVASGIKAHWAPRDADREDEDKTANAGTEEDGVIEWICDIPPGKTQELSLAWEVSGPAGKHWVRH